MVGLWQPYAASGSPVEPKPPGGAIVTSQWRYRRRGRRHVVKIHNYVYISKTCAVIDVVFYVVLGNFSNKTLPHT
ncbi:MAG: hypothetical protein ACK4SY_10760, partial [Pyrobaculum sp.]